MSQPGSCPICRKPVADRFRPFCSKRCADIDLGTWFKGGYVVPGPEAEASTPAEPGKDEED